MKAAISEATRRRQIQLAYNAEHGIDPTTIRRNISDILLGAESEAVLPKGKSRRSRERREISLPKDELVRLVQSLEDEMHEAAKGLRFEYAARLRDEVADLKRELKALA
jgi:excinuclease ABC subunit B